MKSKFLLTLALAGVSISVSFGQATVDPELRAALATNPTAQVIVTFQGNGAPGLTQLGLLQRLGITRGITLRALPVAGVVATAAQVDALAQNPEVRSLYINKRLEYYNYDDTNLTGVKRLRTDQQMTARNGGLPVSGKGVGVLINDSGVDGTHEDLKFGTHLVQNTLGSTNLNSLSSLLPVTYLEGVPNTDTNSGHGTHCAGTVGGTGARSGGKYEGVAPGASLLGYGSGGALLVLDAIGGFDYALTHQFQYNIRVISNSFGSSGDFDPNDPLNVATKKCYDRGMVVVFAAGNEGPGADTHNPYAIAPWTISVGAGDRNGLLAEFSSRGVRGEQGTFMVDGESWTYKNEPVIVAPGVDVVSTRAIAPVSSLGIQTDAEVLSPAEIPFYTHSSGTSMATPHVAGIVALLLEAKPTLSPAQVKELLQSTATNMPGRQSWEVGAGYVNAYAAVDKAFRSAAYGSAINASRLFKSSVDARTTAIPFTINYNPALAAGNQFTFPVASGTNSLEVKISTTGLLGETGNLTNLILLDPNGVQYRSGIPVTFTLSTDRSVAVAAPVAGTWTLKVEGLQGVALPETINGNITVLTAAGTTNLSDIVGHPAEASIKMAVANRLVDGLSNGFRPDAPLTRIQLADYLLMGQGIRQLLPFSGARTFSDVSTPAEILLTESVVAKGAALRDRFNRASGVMLPTATGTFSPSGLVNRAALAYSLVQSLGFQEQALARNSQPLTVQVSGQTIPVDDAASIPAALRGYVSIALELNLINAYYSLTQGAYDQQPTLHATFKPAQNVSRADFAVIVSRTFPQYEAQTQPTAQASSNATALGAAPAMAQSKETVAYPNPAVGTTTLNYYVAQDGPVSVEVYNTLGRKVKTLVSASEAAGGHQLQFDASSLARGTYLFRVKTGQSVSTTRLMVQ
ncbi:S8 family serine peptidase [Hymenobacter taeanensis]|uniref:S8 family serine peptidase n=1 Tax=Hymenobacter taeanensis TaxID=2735321 RepID=A0A6M6BK30_9BACT|nr:MULTISPECIES: S8 family serine peptidase [Hymenobacter]QJX47435.1 S8 family serine peptidase [Hymenobacter taeanensis]UOQ83083.1 S8 family serine peptidase [Hymenobacter sp. 5414T-23]